MTIKQKNFVAKLIDNKGNATQAYKDAGYAVKTDTVARVESSRLLANPSVQSSLAEHNHLFESVITNTVRDWSTEEDTAKRSLAVNTAKWGYEQIHGKATQRTESVSASFIQHTSDKAKQYGL